MVRRLVLALVLALTLAPLAAAQTGYYWDDPETLVRQGGRYPTAVDNGKTAAAFWQERRQSTGGWAQSFLSVTIRNQDDSGWTTRHNVLGPFTIVGSEAQIYSAVLTASGVFWVAVLAEEGQIVLYRSEDGAKTFHEDGRLTADGNLLVPKLFLGQGDQPLLLVNKADATSFRLYASRREAPGWTALSSVTPEENQRQSFQPTVVRIGAKLVLVYQSQFTSQATATEGSRITYQIYRKESSDGGKTWGAPVRLSNYADDLADNPDTVDNQRPAAYWFHDRLFVAWERRTARTQSGLEVTAWSETGKKLENQLLTATNFTARNPLFYTFRDKLTLAWFDNRNETYDVFLSSWDPDPDVGWATPDQLTKDTGNSVFGQPARLGNDLYFFWQNNFGDTPGIVFLKPDRHADPPSLKAVNFKVGVKTKNPAFTVEVGYPRDVSGIKAFNVLLTQDPTAEPDHDHRLVSKDRLWTANVPQEGTWFLAVNVVDNAGNWSSATRITLDLKTTPPGPVLFDRPDTDARGYLASNTFQLTWKPTTSDTVAYSWRLSRVGDVLTQKLLTSLAPSVPAGPPGTSNTAGGVNLEDGLWALAVSTFDEAGNQGPVTTQYFRLNKFRPYTVISSVETQQDAFGRAQLAIHGRGFADGGAINRVYLDRDGKEPFDYELGPDKFSIVNDRLVEVKVEGLAEGVYRVGVGHPERGRVFTGPVLKVDPTGTVKVGDYRNLDQTVWTFFQGITLFFSVHAVYFWAVMAFLVAVLWGTLKLFTQAWTDLLNIRRQTAAWFADNPNKWAREARRFEMKARRSSLTIKFAASILSLTGVVILMLSLTLGFFITQNSQLTLGTALQQRTQVLLDSLATGARTYLPTANYNELSNLPQQISAMEGEALYATITGPSSEKKTGLSYVYASNDPNLKAKTDTANLIPGVTVLKDPVEAQWAQLQKDLNTQAEAAVGDQARQIEEVTKQARPLAEKTDPASKALLSQYEDQNSSLKRQVITKLAEVAGKARSYPAFNTDQLLGAANQQYLFYQPFLYYTAGDPTYVRGLIRIEVSSATIEKQIVASRDQLIFVTIIVALVALVLGLLGAFALSAITVNPIQRLVKGVATIRDTDDKTHLDGHVIEVNTHDELQELASTVNEMTHSLVKGAKQSKEMAGAKGLQKTYFISLDKDIAGNKTTTFEKADIDGIDVFAYYEGAKTVSGDLYEFRQLDALKNPKSPWYGIMKGDISGKGVEALLAMTIAAAAVTNFFRRWTEAKDGRATKIDAMLNGINDTLEPILAETGAQKFAALNVGILNAVTGELQFCQAGDNLLHLWRAATADKPAHFELMQLEKTAPAGLDSSQYHQIKYRNQKLQLLSGDTLLYFTDGIEESQCTYRNKNWDPVAYFNPDDKSTLTVPGARKAVPVFEGGPLRDVQAKDVEDFGPERMEAIIEAYQHRTVYALVKQNWEHPDIEYHFDFSTCEGSSRGLVLALISIDRIFRLIPDPRATAFDFIDLDEAEDEFLKKHFVEFSRFFKDGSFTYRQAVPGKENMDADGFFLAGAVPVPVWQKGVKGKDEVDADGFKLVDGERVQAFLKARRGDARDADGYKLVEGARVKAYEKGDISKGDSVSPEGYKVTGGSRERANPGYIRYRYLKEDPQFDDLTLLAIRKK